MDRQRDEKEEKELGKRDEKSAEEKWRRDPLGSVTWAAILIWAGLVFLADNLGFLDALRFGRGEEEFFFLGPGVWSLVLIGAGGLLLLEVVIRLLVPAYRQAIGGSLFLGLLFIGLGLSNWIGWELLWPFILIAIGLSIVLRSLFRRR
jgi:hypothetical protein